MRNCEFGAFGGLTGNLDEVSCRIAQSEDHGLNFLVHAGLEDLLHSRGQGSRDSRVLGALEVVGLRDWGQWWV